MRVDATFLTGAVLALSLILALGASDRVVAILAFALVPVLDPAAGRVFCASFETDVVGGADLVSACEVVAANASPTTTPAVVIRILSSQRAADAPATPV